jgi:hypothetical protein
VPYHPRIRDLLTDAWGDAHARQNQRAEFANQTTFAHHYWLAWTRRRRMGAGAKESSKRNFTDDRPDNNQGLEFRSQ